MCGEVLDRLDLQPGDRVLDCTVGGAGHSAAILERIGADGFLWGIERDPRTIERARERLAAVGNSFCLIQGNFADLEELARQHQIQALDAVLLDLGTSIFQLREAERGFSFLEEGPLDMRMNPEEGVPSAADLVNGWSETDLRELFRTLGEERFAGRIARVIVETRQREPFRRTTQLAETVIRAVPRTDKRRDRLHPATRVFQALRIAVNDELGAIEKVLPLAVGLLKSGGRIAVIAFHSLEDRIVKQSLRTMSASCVCPPRMPICTCAQVPLLARPAKAMFPSEAEVLENAPSRSARLRVATRL
ncbi:MAG: 16S rRNA (cytosine(1402)-N(4))-methyltransferase [Candidatus Melainabacteria bacterium HGW-Melainabacteria-1]|nr:MAG: 16S rRNA (cytosine(1402)-N(4))-methyltransferase [Candidatus Melainabacteria bacterium HGW-Melainabacteria-1]